MVGRIGFTFLPSWATLLAVVWPAVSPALQVLLSHLWEKEKGEKKKNREKKKEGKEGKKEIEEERKE